MIVIAHLLFTSCLPAIHSLAASVSVTVDDIVPPGDSVLSMVHESMIGTQDTNGNNQSAIPQGLTECSV